MAKRRKIKEGPSLLEKPMVLSIPFTCCTKLTSTGGKLWNMRTKGILNNNNKNQKKTNKQTKRNPQQSFKNGKKKKLKEPKCFHYVSYSFILAFIPQILVQYLSHRESIASLCKSCSSMQRNQGYTALQTEHKQAQVSGQTDRPGNGSLSSQALSREKRHTPFDAVRKPETPTQVTG